MSMDGRGRMSRDDDGRRRFRGETTEQLNLRLRKRLRRAFIWLADQHERPYNETFELLLEKALAERGLTIDGPEFDPAPRRPPSGGTTSAT